MQSHSQDTAMLRMYNVSKVYRTDLIETHALRNFSLEVAAGEFVAVTGPSGSGKTTFLNVAGLLETFDTGRYLLDGQDVSRLSDDERSRLRNEKIGFIFQSFNLLPRMTALANVMQPLIYAGVPLADRRREAMRYLERVGLADRADHLPSQLSGGQRQRVAIARALINEPAILLADEPTGNLDSQTGEEIMALFDSLHKAGQTIVLVTHEPDIAEHAQRRIFIRDGVIERDERDWGAQVGAGSAAVEPHGGAT